LLITLPTLFMDGGVAFDAMMVGARLKAWRVSNRWRWLASLRDTYLFPKDSYRHQI